MADIPVEHRRYEPASYDVATTVPSLLKRVSWGAIFAGAIVGLGILILLGLLGSAIGIGAIDPGQEADPLGGLGTGTAIWWVISSLIALFIGGYVAGKLAGFPSRSTAMMHGLTVWALVTFLTLWLASSVIGSVVNTAASALTSATRAVASAAASATSNIPAGEAQQMANEARNEALQVARDAGLGQQQVDEAGQVLENTAQDILRSPGDLGADLNNMIDELFRGEGAVVSPAERDRLARTIAGRLGVSEAEAEQIADRWVNETRVAADQVTNQVETGIGNAADTLSAIAWGAFFTSLAALLAGIFGAAAGAPKEPYMNVHHRVDDDGDVHRTTT